MVLDWEDYDEDYVDDWYDYDDFDDDLDEDWDDYEYYPDLGYYD